MTRLAERVSTRISGASRPSAAQALMNAMQGGVPTSIPIQQGPASSAAIATLDDCKQAIGKLGEWIRDNDAIAGMDAH